MPGSSRGGRSDWPEERPRPSLRGRGGDGSRRGYRGDDTYADDDDDDDRAAGRDDDGYGGGYGTASRSGSRQRPAAGRGSAPGRRYDDEDDGYGGAGYGQYGPASGSRSRADGPSRLSEYRSKPDLGRGGGSYADGADDYGASGGYGAAGPSTRTRRALRGGDGGAGYGQYAPPSGGRAGGRAGERYGGYGDDDQGAVWADGTDDAGYGQGAGRVYGADYYRQSGGDRGPAYGSAGAQSRDWQGGNGMFAQPPANDPLFGYEPAEVAAKRSRRNRTLTVVLSVLLVLGLLGGGAVFVLAQIGAPAATVGFFCGDLRARQYASAYALLGGGLKTAATGSQFAEAMANLDAAEGAVTQCGLAPGGSFSYRLFGSVASGDFTMTRASAGTLRGAIHLTNQGGAWRLDQIDDALFGVSLGAAAVFSAYCADIQIQQYDDAYTFLTADIQGKITKADYTAQEQIQDTIDGKVSDCHLMGVGKDATDTATSLSASITRATLGERKGTFTLTLEKGAWKVAHVETQLLGTDLGPLAATERFCHDLSVADYHDIYGLLTTNFTGGDSEAGVTTIWNGNYNGVKWTGCTPDVKTYGVDGQKASVVAQFDIQRVATGQAGTVKFKVLLVVAENAWKIDDWQRQP